MPSRALATVAELARRLDRTLPLHPARPVCWPTGLPSLDALLGGGLWADQLTLLAAAPGAGKTSLALQVARNVARAGHPAVLVAFEHSAVELLARLTCLEAAPAPLDYAHLRRQLHQAAAQGRGLDDLLRQEPAASRAWGAIATYWTRLRLWTADPDATTARLLERAIAAEPPALWIVDSLQRVAAEPHEAAFPPAVRAALVAGRLKEAARASGVPLLATSQVTVDGLSAPRLAMDHLEGGAPLAHVADVILAGAPDASGVTWAAVKNRNAAAGAVTLRFDGPHFRFAPEDDPRPGPDPTPTTPETSHAETA